MKVEQAFAATYKKVQEENKYLNSRPQTLLSAIIAAENKKSFLELKNLFARYKNYRFSQKIFWEFRRFLMKRWKEVQNTTLAYYLVPNEPFTQLCVTLARDLANLHVRNIHNNVTTKDLPYYAHHLAFLMPTIETFNPLTGMDIYESDQQVEENAIAEAIEASEKRFLATAKINMIDEQKEEPVTKPCVPLVYQVKNSSDILSPQQLKEVIRKAKALAEKKKIALNHFVLSEKNGYLISVQHCLVDSKFDGVMKHTSAVTRTLKKLIRLSAKEKNKVIFHSSEALRLYNAIQNYQTIRNQGLSIGAAVNRLICRLLKASEKGGYDGTQSLAGVDAAIGIRKFYNYISLLPEALYNMLMDARYSLRNDDQNFRTEWYELLGRFYYFENNDENRIVLTKTEECELNIHLELAYQYPCVKIIADNIESILHQNLELYHVGLDPSSLPQSTYILLDELIEIRARDYHLALKAVHEAEKAFEYALRENLFHPLNYNVCSVNYNDPELRNGMHLPNYHQHLREQERWTVRHMAKCLVDDADDISDVLTGIPRWLQERFLNDGLGVEYLKSYFSYDISSILYHPCIVPMLGKDFVRSHVDSVSILKMVVSHCEFQVALNFIKNVLGRSHLLGIFKKPEDIQQVNNPLRSTLRAFLGAENKVGTFFQRNELRPVIGILPTPETRLSLSGR